MPHPLRSLPALLLLALAFPACATSRPREEPPADSTAGDVAGIPVGARVEALGAL